MNESELAPIVDVEIDLESLMDQFFSVRRDEEKRMGEAIETRDFTTIKKIAHRIKGTAGSYGFMGMSKLGGEIEELALVEDLESIKSLHTLLRNYLATVQVRFVKMD